MNEAFKKFTEELKAAMTASLASSGVKELIEKTKAAEDSGTFEVVISTADQDRQGEIVDQNGWDLTNYLKNPVVLWAHDYMGLPIGVADEIQTKDGITTAKGRFAPAEANPFAQQVRKLYDLKMLQTTSVGFIAKEVNDNVITKAELLEFSFVPVPANPFALSLRKAQELSLDVEMMRTKGIEFKEQEEEPKPAAPAEPETPVNSEQQEGGQTTPADLPVEPKETNQPNEETKSKSGRVLSERNRILIMECIEKIKLVTAALEELHDAAEPQGSGEKESPKQRSKDAGSDEAALNEWLFSRQVLRSINNATSDALAKFNAKVRIKK